MIGYLYCANSKSNYYLRHTTNITLCFKRPLKQAAPFEKKAGLVDHLADNLP